MEKAVTRFLADLTAGRGFSPRTEEAYRRDLADWLAFLDRRPGAGGRDSTSSSPPT